MKAKTILALTLALSCGLAHADESLEKRASWEQPTAAQVKDQIAKWLSDTKADEAALLKAETLWATHENTPLAGETLDRTVEVIAAIMESVRPLTQLCSQDAAPLSPPAFDFLADESVAPFVRNNLRLFYGRWLAQHNLYDESLAHINPLKVDDVVDPTALLFYQSVAHHRLLQKEKCLPALAKLMENKGKLPRRYENLATLMEMDMKPLKVDSLDEVARLMDDIERRLDLGRAGKRVRKEEDDVIAKLDKMIEELEKQQQQQQQQQQGQSGSQPSSPMQESQNAQLQGPGQVDPRRFTSRSAWGDLPAKERQEVLQQIGKGLPSHYREVIEEYFRKIARDEERE